MNEEQLQEKIEQLEEAPNDLHNGDFLLSWNVCCPMKDWPGTSEDFPQPEGKTVIHRYIV